MADTVPFKYRAFLSYSHRDRAWAEWLHAALEKKRIDPDLVGRASVTGPVPRHLRPIFRDREDFSAGHSLTIQTRAALDGSQFLIAVCSPNAAKSTHVNEEIRHFKSSGRSAQVIAVTVAGEPGGSERECFPPALLVKIAPDGTLTSEHEEPIAADARTEGDGKRMAFLKVVAGLIGLPFDDVRKREAIAESRRIKIFAAGLAVVASLAVVAGLVIWEYQRREDNLSVLWNEMRATLSENSKEAAIALRKLGAIAERRDPQQARDFYARAAALEPDAPEKSLDPQKSLWDSWLEVEASDLNAAENSYQEAKADPGNATRQRDLLVSHNKVGDVFKAQGNLSEALKSYRDGLAIADTLGRRDFSFSKISDVLKAVSYNKIGDILKAQGDLPDALKSYYDGVAIRDRLVKAEPGNDGWRRDLSVSYERIGDALLAQGNLPEALKSYRDRLAIVDRLVKADPGNAGWQRDLAVSYAKLADVFRREGEATKALDALRQGRAIIARMTGLSPDNAVWRRDLSWFDTQIAALAK